MKNVSLTFSNAVFFSKMNQGISDALLSDKALGAFMWDNMDNQVVERGCLSLVSPHKKHNRGTCKSIFSLGVAGEHVHFAD